jgi:hypothetical protein
LPTTCIHQILKLMYNERRVCEASYAFSAIPESISRVEAHQHHNTRAAGEHFDIFPPIPIYPLAICRPACSGDCIPPYFPLLVFRFSFPIHCNVYLFSSLSVFLRSVVVGPVLQPDDVHISGHNNSQQDRREYPHPTILAFLRRVRMDLLR